MGRKEHLEGCVGGSGWWAVQEEAAKSRCIILTGHDALQKCISGDVKHSRSFCSNGAGMQHGDHLCQLSSERRFLQPEVGVRTAVHPAVRIAELSASHPLLLLHSFLAAPFQAGMTLGCREVGSLAQIQWPVEGTGFHPVSLTAQALHEHSAV